MSNNENKSDVKPSGQESNKKGFSKKQNVPTDPVDPDDKIAMKKWERASDAYHKWSILTSENLKALKELIWGQCSQNMQQKIQSLPNFATIRDGIALLIAIQNTQKHTFLNR